METFDFLSIDLRAIKELGINLNQYGILYNLKNKKDYKWLINEQNLTNDIEFLKKKNYIKNEQINEDISEILFGETTKGFERFFNSYPDVVRSLNGGLRMVRTREKECRTLYNRLTEKGKYRRYLQNELEEYLNKIKNTPQFTVGIHRFLRELDKETLIKKWSTIEEENNQNDIQIL